MLKHIIIALFVSLVVIFWIKDAALIVHWIYASYTLIVTLLGNVFSGGVIGDLIRKTISILVVPFIVAIIPTGIYYAIARKQFDYFPHVFWATWLILYAVLAVK